MMVQEKLRNLRKQKGISQEKMAKILSTDPSNYSRKERGEVRIHDEEWQKLAEALEVPVEDIKEEKELRLVHNDNSTFNDNSGNYYNQHFNIPNSVIENLQDYISLLKQKVYELEQEIKSLKS
ncbi:MULTISPECIES: helix-turn-helix domain-containing protein [unclassified Chryseobacterium]|uniref:helix-turn-helix domain-containing protein n=1 Tax=unclassified Chryseobacterium TaxID=2593645 RepID=UPI000D9E75D4|nr:MULTISPECIES: helix-turn-helix transcriptional regulator [unclassified Chryseobacterium]PWW27117.1 transcriptional regulator with XRE-family HTH domain [Chryseobacterium sp. AG844]